MKKLWKVEVNNWGWDEPCVLYAESREAAKEIANKYPVSDDVRYAGNFTEANACELLE